MTKQITAILLGAGNRGEKSYASYALNYPNELKFIGVAEPRKDRRDAFAKAHEIQEENAVSSWEQLLNRPRMADCVLICTQDQMHYEPLKMAVKKGYHILCEKPITPVKEELLDIYRIAGEYNRTISICHVLRYSPFFIELKKLLTSGAIGELVDIQHMESVGYWHMAHSFVRGNWRNQSLSSPMILQKCCHDFDILLWLVGSPCTSVSSFGRLSHFTEEHAPDGSTQYCMDGCEAREHCPFFAPCFYLEHPRAISDGFAQTVSLDISRSAILSALKNGPYGRCVYHCDNDVVDHQIVNMQFENGVTASLTMCAFTEKCERVINLMGTRGQIKGNMEENRIEWTDFTTGHTSVIQLHVPAGGHSGSDVTMMRQFVRLVNSSGKEENRSAATEAVESHFIALAAEESRLAGGAVITLSGSSINSPQLQEEENESGNN